MVPKTMEKFKNQIANGKKGNRLHLFYVSHTQTHFDFRVQQIKNSLFCLLVFHCPTDVTEQVKGYTQHTTCFTVAITQRRSEKLETIF